MIGQRTIAGPAEPNTSRKNGRSGRTREADTRMGGVLLWLAIDMRIGGAASLSSGCSVVHFRRCMRRGDSLVLRDIRSIRASGKEGSLFHSLPSPPLEARFTGRLVRSARQRRCLSAYSLPSVCRDHTDRREAREGGVYEASNRDADDPKERKTSDVLSRVSMVDRRPPDVLPLSVTARCPVAYYCCCLLLAAFRVDNPR
jgi:hypothetical protein